ncbi:anthranilate synthase component I family protein [Aliarcobacter skirrowii]|uniref:Anthranilate synthase component 1 n=1 Tax=Aliarcobacter skirrowii TaxID=28200 RepID=A0A2U2BYZ7_9BACT|nr:chorismate-binding protein [Aliarcobacter skirrowii]PWE20053.1 anthranilate synthase component I [Aliarcobacter skirrowii]PWE20154.1 anthranilate synthase component I [Aliarcobacter skirrowii]PWE24562.1 anthranilate synthase component I [Aliarcobacter skirrowii]RJO55500.1 anthranilate synthase component I family protein [Aliarcobacter skirrowii]RJO57455.1 anthranilate synthase component I family protein [Aliarcobacter skirrowii]
MIFYNKTLFLDQFTPVSIYEKVKALYSKELSFLFESTISSGNDGNFSYIIIGARERIWYKNSECFFQNESGDIKKVDNNPLLFLKKYYKKFDKEIYKNRAKELGIGLIDGFIGNIGYDISKEFEPKLKSSMQNLKDQLDIADFDLIRPKIILAYSHKTSKLTILTSVDKLKNELETIEEELLKPYNYTPLKKATILDEGKFNYSKEEFFSMVEDAKEMIRSGDIFQILISNRFIQSAVVDHLSFYRALRSKNPSPYLFLLQFEDFSIAGSSPEVMIRLVDNHMLLRPIAGTRKRGATLQKDLEMENELLNDVKERSEHLMLVDLGRNDVGRVARAGSVKVTELMRIEKYSHVMHMVSDVEAVLDEKYDMFDLFMATFTAGTMTGAPKIRAMELIANFEKIKRSFYSGSVAYFGFDGNMDSAITIRTSLLTKDKIIFQSGAGIVADSKNEDEFLEVHNKLAANIATLKDLS